MTGNKIFFNFKKDKIMTVIISLQLILAIFCVYEFLTTAFFKIEYTKLYEKSYDIENGFKISFIPANIEGISVDVKKILEKLSLNNINGELMIENIDNNYLIPREYLNISKKLLKSREEDNGDTYENIEPIKMNFNALEWNKEKILGDINPKTWEIKNNKVPVVVGKNFKEKFKVGDTFKFNNKIFEIVGQMTDDILYATHYDSILTAKDMSGKFIIPIEESDYLNLYQNDPITIRNISKEEVCRALMEFQNLFEFKTYQEDYNWFNNEIKYDLFKKTIKTLILTLVSLSSLFITLLIKVISTKDRFGILYSLGINKREVHTIFLTEFSPIIYGVIVISFIITCVFGKYSFRYFYVMNKEIYLAIALLIILVMTFICFEIIFRQIDKLTPKKMLEDFNK